MSGKLDILSQDLIWKGKTEVLRLLRTCNVDHSLSLKQLSSGFSFTAVTSVTCTGNTTEFPNATVFLLSILLAFSSNTRSILFPQRVEVIEDQGCDDVDAIGLMGGYAVLRKRHTQTLAQGWSYIRRQRPTG